MKNSIFVPALYTSANTCHIHVGKSKLNQEKNQLKHLTMFDEDVTVRAPMPRWLLLPCSFDKVQGGQTWPPLVPKNFSRLLPHKAAMGSLSQDEKLQQSPWPPIFQAGKELWRRIGFRWACWLHSPRNKVTWGKDPRQARLLPTLSVTAARLLRWLDENKKKES